MLSTIRGASGPQHEIQRGHTEQQDAGNRRGAQVSGPDAGCEHHDTDDGAERRRIEYRYSQTPANEPYDEQIEYRRRLAA